MPRFAGGECRGIVQRWEAVRNGSTKGSARALGAEPPPTPCAGPAPASPRARFSPALRPKPSPQSARGKGARVGGFLPSISPRSMGPQLPLWVMGSKLNRREGKPPAKVTLFVRVLIRVQLMSSLWSPGTSRLAPSVFLFCLFVFEAPHRAWDLANSETLGAGTRGPPLPPGLGCSSLSRSGRRRRAGKWADTAGACAGQGPLGTPQPMTTTGT